MIRRLLAKLARSARPPVRLRRPPLDIEELHRDAQCEGRRAERIAELFPAAGGRDPWAGVFRGGGATPRVAARQETTTTVLPLLRTATRTAGRVVT